MVDPEAAAADGSTDVFREMIAKTREGLPGEVGADAQTADVAIVAEEHLVGQFRLICGSPFLPSA